MTLNNNHNKVVINRASSIALVAICTFWSWCSRAKWAGSASSAWNFWICVKSGMANGRRSSRHFDYRACAVFLLFFWRIESERLGANFYTFYITSQTNGDLHNACFPALCTWFGPQFVRLLTAHAGKMKQILRRDWLPAQSRWNCLARSGLLVTRAPSSTVNPCNKSFIGQACSVKIAGYWPPSFASLFLCSLPWVPEVFRGPLRDLPAEGRPLKPRENLWGRAVWFTVLVELWPFLSHYI